MTAQPLSTRGRLRAGLAAAAITALGACTALSACTARSDQQSAPREAVEGGTLTWSKPAEAVALDPTTSLLGSSWELLNIVYDRLVTVDANQEVQPSLADSWENPTPTEYTFHLRPNATFSNGRQLTADDVVGSFERYLDPASGSLAPALLGPKTKVSKVDDQTVTFQLAEANVDFLSALSATFMSILPMEEIESGDLDPTKELLGTGSFKVDKHVENQVWELSQNPNAWAPATLDKLTIRIVPDDSSRVAALRDGSTDIATFDLPEAGELLEGTSNTEVVVQNRSDYYLLQLNAIDNPAFKDERVRQAIGYALDRESIRDVGLSGLGEPTGPASSALGDRGCDLASTPGYSRDVEKARSLLAEAGHEDLSFEIIYAGDPFGRIAQVVQQNLEEVGVEVKLTNLEEGVWLQRAWIDNPAQMDATITWFAGYSGPTMAMNWWNPVTAGFTQGFQIDDPDVNSSIAAAQQAVGNEQEQVQKACEAIATQANQIPLLTKPITVAYRTDRVEAEFASVDGVIDPLASIENFTLLAP